MFILNTTPKIVSNWDYLGYKKIYKDVIDKNEYLFDFQFDWNSLLLTKINEVSANICKISNIGGANIIVMNSKLFMIFKNSEIINFISENNGELFLANRYKIILNDDIIENYIYVYLDNNSDFIGIIGVENYN